MMNGSWDTQCNWQNFLPFWTIFCPFTPVTTRKIKILKKRKYPGDIITLHKSTENHDHTLHFSWNTMHDRCNFYFHFGLVFALLPSPLTTQKIQILQKWKKYLEISSFYTCITKIMITWCTVSEIWCTMDGKMDRRTEKY